MRAQASREGFGPLIANRVHHVPDDVDPEAAGLVAANFARADSRGVRRLDSVQHGDLKPIRALAAFESDETIGTATIGEGKI
jgi:hypothetical protein